jgi:hypothetical protein
VLRVEPREPLLLVRPHQLLLRGLAQGQEEAKVPIGDRGRFTGILELFERVLANSLQVAVTRDIALRLHHDQRFVHQPRDQVEHLELVGLLAPDRGRGFQRPTSGEDGQAPQELLLQLREVVVAPLNRGPKGLLPGKRGAAPSREKPESIVELGADLFHG